MSPGAVSIVCSGRLLGRGREGRPAEEKQSEGGRLTSRGRLDHVADGEALDGLVLGRAPRAVGAADGLDVAAALLVAAIVLPLLDHFGGCPEEAWLENVEETEQLLKGETGTYKGCAVVVSGVG